MESKSTMSQLVLNSQILPVAKGMFSAKIRGGASISVAKSSLQKSIRRGQIDLAQISGLLWFETGLLLVGLMTNLVNRMIVIAGEDCSVNLQFLHWIDAQITEIRLLRKKMKGQDVANAQILKEKISHMIAAMVTVPKTRISSWLKAVFYDGLNCPQTQDQVESVYPGLNDLKTKYDLLTEKAHSTALASKYPLLSIRYAVKALLNKKEGELNEAWTNLLKIKDDANIRLFYKWFKNENEERIYLILAHIYVCHPDWFDHSDWTCETPSATQLSKWEDMAFNKEIKIPMWMVDLHTVEGKKLGMNKIDFAQVGSKIENIWKPMYVQKWIDVYETLKKIETMGAGNPPIPPLFTENKKGILGGLLAKIPIKLKPSIKITLKKKSDEDKKTPIVSKEKTTLTVVNDSGVLDEKFLSIITAPSVPRGQKVTSAWKPYVYLPKEYPKWVFKGPFAPKRFDRLEKLKRRYEAFKLLGTPVIDLDILDDHKGYKWVRYSNVASTSPDQWKTKSEHDKINNIDVQTIIRESLGFKQLSKLDSSLSVQLLFEGDHPLYIAFLDASLFGCGDMGEHNALVVSGSKPACYIIDYDDTTTKKEFHSYYDVYRGIKSKAQKNMFDLRVPTIKKLITDRIQLYRLIQAKLEQTLGESLEKTIGEMEKVYV